MTVQNLLEKMNERAFGPAFQEYLFDTYKAMAQADFPEEEKGYTAAKDYFITTLQHAEIEILSQIEANFIVAGSISTFPTAGVSLSNAAFAIRSLPTSHNDLSFPFASEHQAMRKT